MDFSGLFMMGNLVSWLMFFTLVLSYALILGLTRSFYRVKLLLDLILLYILIGFSLTWHAPSLLSNEEPKLRSNVFSLKEYLYLGALTASN